MGWDAGRWRCRWESEWKEVGAWFGGPSDICLGVCRSGGSLGSVCWMDACDLRGRHMLHLGPSCGWVLAFALLSLNAMHRYLRLVSPTFAVRVRLYGMKAKHCLESLVPNSQGRKSRVVSGMAERWPAVGGAGSREAPHIVIDQLIGLIDVLSTLLRDASKRVLTSRVNRLGRLQLVNLDADNLPTFQCES
jgi:hypothetical protein